MTKPNDYALIIGVHDYRAADPSGRSDVAGALNDARTWVRQCLSMGFSPDRIRVLTTPKLSPEDLGPKGASIALGEATQEGMLAGIRWLMQAIGGEVPAAALLTFSGHGEVSNGHLLLCPSDVTASLDGVIDVAELRQAIGAGKAAQNLTALIDGCHGQVGLDREQSLRANLRARAEARPVPEGSGVSERVIAACRKDQESESSRFGGERMGAFTWAMTSVLGQWRVEREHGVNRSTASYGELLSRTRALLAALSFEQEPVLSGPPGVAGLPFLHPGGDLHPGETSPTPDGRRPPRQLDAGERGYRVYQFSWNEALLATVLVPAISNGAYVAGTEYWFLNAETAKQVSRSGTVTAKLEQDNEWSTPFAPPAGAIQQTTGAPASWARAAASPSAFAAQPSSGLLGIYFSFASNNAGTYYLSLVKWFSPTSNGYWYFNDSSQPGDTLLLGWSTDNSFAFEYDAGFTRPGA